MSLTLPSAVVHVAEKIARVPGVELSAIARDGAVDAIIEGGYNRPLREQLLQLGHRALVPVRVFYRMPDGRAIGESEARAQKEAIEDFYTDVHVSGFVGSKKSPEPSKSAGDAYGDWPSKDDAEERDDYGQLKLCRLRLRTRGRPVVGWKYGDKAVRKGDKVKFKKAASLQWTMGRMLRVKPGATGEVMDLSSRRPILYLKMGGRDQVELPVHAVGHIYDVMLSANLESIQRMEEGFPLSNFNRMMMAVGFGRLPGDGDTPTNPRNFKGPTQPDLIGYTSSTPEEDKLVPPGENDKNKKTKVTVRKPSGDKEQKTVLLGGENTEEKNEWLRIFSTRPIEVSR